MSSSGTYGAGLLEDNTTPPRPRMVLVLIMRPRVLVAVPELLLLAPPEDAVVPDATAPDPPLLPPPPPALPPPPPPLLPPAPPLPPPPPDPLLLLFLLEFLLRSSLSLMTENGSLASLPSSNKRAKCEGPTAICFTSSLIVVSAELPGNKIVFIEKIFNFYI